MALQKTIQFGIEDTGLRWILLLVVVGVSFFVPAYSQVAPRLSADQEKLIVEEAPNEEAIAFGKTIIVKGSAKGALAFSGNVVIEGRVEGDVAAVGGSVFQKENSYVGGDIIVLGGTYHHEGKPSRGENKKTIVYAGYEQELRKIFEDPTTLFMPDFSWSFASQRLLSTLFWFVVGLGLTTLAPGAISRASARLKLSALKVSGLGFLGVLACSIGVVVALSFLPGYLGVFIGMMMLFLLGLAIVFGRVTLQAVVGKWLQKMFVPEKYHSESGAILIGAFFLTLLLSLPYFLAFATLALVSVSLGLVLTARSPKFGA